MKGLWDRLQETAGVVRGRVREAPEVAVVLGTGLGGFGARVEQPVSFPYSELPHFPESTSPGHEGKLIFGKVGPRRVAVMEGRFHCYEGYTPQQVTYPLRLFQSLGTKTLIITNAAGGLNPGYRAGDLMAIEDHINLMGVNPLVGPNDDRLGIRFPDLSEPYDAGLRAAARAAAGEEGFPLREGVYVGVLGPNLETRAEYRFLRRIGADAVGMSTIPEVLVAVHAGMRVLGLSVVTDLCDPDHLKPAVVEEIIRVANEAEPKLTHVVSRVIERL